MKPIILFIRLAHRMDKLQPVLINVLIRAIFECFKFSQGSIATHLRCSGIFGDRSIRQSLLSLLVKEF